MAKNIAIKKVPTPKLITPLPVIGKKNALQDHNWAVLAACASFVVAMVASLAVAISMLSTNLALAFVVLLMAVVQGCLIYSVLQYHKLGWWAGLLFIWCFWLFGLPCLLLNILPPMYNAYGYVLLVVSLIPFALLIWQRNRFLK